MAARYVFECPYYIRYRSDRNEMHCEGGIVLFQSRNHRHQYLSAHCCCHPGWKDCSIAKHLAEHYEEVVNE